MGDLSFTIHAEEKNKGTVRNQSFGRQLNPLDVMSKINLATDNKDISIPDGRSEHFTDSGINDDSISLSSSSSSSSSSSDSYKSVVERRTVRKHYFRVKKYKDVLLKVNGFTVLTVCVVKAMIKTRKIKRFIVIEVKDYCENKIRTYDQIIKVNEKNVEDIAYDEIEDTLTLHSDSSIKLELKRWDPVEGEHKKYHIKEVLIDLRISKNPNKRLQKRAVKDLKFKDKERSVVLRLDQFTGDFVFRKDQDLMIGPMGEEIEYFYHFVMREFECVVNGQTREGVVISYHHGGVYRDISSNLVNDDTEVVTKIHECFKDGNPDERFFLVCRDIGYEDPDAQRYESLLYPDMCFKFDKEGNNFVMGRFSNFGTSVDCYYFNDFTIDQDGSISIEVNSTNGNPTAMLKKHSCENRSRNFKSNRQPERLFSDRLKELCCIWSYHGNNNGDIYYDNDRVLHFFKKYEDTEHRTATG